jgi:hypothetical protein
MDDYIVYHIHKRTANMVSSFLVSAVGKLLMRITFCAS